MIARTARHVLICAENPALGRALAAHLEMRLGVLTESLDWADEDLDANTVVVGCRRSLTPADCAALVGRGVRVVILVPVPRADERQKYVAAGASGYLAMNVSTNELARTVASLLDTYVRVG